MHTLALRTSWIYAPDSAAQGASQVLKGQRRKPVMPAQGLTFRFYTGLLATTCSGRNRTNTTSFRSQTGGLSYKSLGNRVVPLRGTISIEKSILNQLAAMTRMFSVMHTLPMMLLVKQIQAPEAGQ